MAFRHRTAVAFCAAVLPALIACALVDDDLKSDAAVPLTGLEISYREGQVDWHAARNGGIAFAYLRATEGGDDIDAMFARNWAKARGAGIARGAYHYFYFCRSAEEQAEWFKKHVPLDNSALPPVLYVEWNTRSRLCLRHPSRDEIRFDLELFLYDVERFYDKKPIIYTTQSFYRSYLADGFEQYPLWLRGGGLSDLPAMIRQDMVSAQVPGIGTAVNKHYFAGSKRAWYFLRTGQRVS